MRVERNEVKRKGEQTHYEGCVKPIESERAECQLNFSEDWQAGKEKVGSQRSDKALASA